MLEYRFPASFEKIICPNRAHNALVCLTSTTPYQQFTPNPSLGSVIYRIPGSKSSRNGLVLEEVLDIC